MADKLSRSAKAPSQRQLRAGELIRHELAQMLQREEVHDDSLSGLNITVTEVQASPDLKHATVFATTLGGLEDERAIAALSAIAPKIRKALAPRLSMKFVPELRFRRDATFDEAERISTLLRGNR